MLKFSFTLLIASLLFCISFSQAGATQKTPTFSLHKLGESQPHSNTLLVIGGIQGDEPGGFHAASILTTHYTIGNGDVWVVPNLNFPSIIKRSRGVHGDLNRKFATINKNDPEYVVVEKIKSIILDEEVDVVLNLHDGSGLYRDEYIDNRYGPHRWGQSVIIDQKDIAVTNYGNLSEIAADVVSGVNLSIKDDTYSYRVKNTKTAEGNVEMAKTLTFFAIKNGKPAFGIEASKLLNKSQRVYYHLLVLENFMKKLGISYKRNFELTVANVGQAIKENRHIAFYDNRIFMEMQDVRNRLNYFPIESSGQVDFWTKNPLITVIEKSSTEYDIYHGNERITTLVPEFFDYDTTPPSINMEIDGKIQDVKMGDTIQVTDSFKILPHSGYRANAIGFSTPNQGSESGVEIKHNDFSKRFSLNTLGNVFRIEFYKTESTSNDDKFAGMVLVKFSQENITPKIANVSTDSTSNLSQLSAQSR